MKIFTKLAQSSEPGCASTRSQRVGAFLRQRSETRHALCPYFETSSCGAVGVDCNAVEFRVEVCPRRVWATEKNIGVEIVSPSRFRMSSDVRRSGRVLQQSVGEPPQIEVRSTYGSSHRPPRVSDVAVVMQTIASECCPAPGPALEERSVNSPSTRSSTLIEQISDVVDRNPIRVEGASLSTDSEASRVVAIASGTE